MESKHWFWGALVVFLSLLGVYTLLVLTGHEEQAGALAGGVGFVSLIVLMGWWIS